MYSLSGYFRLDQPMRLVGRYEYAVLVLDPKSGNIDRKTVDVWKRETDLFNLRKTFQYVLAHSVERVLDRLAVVVRKSMQDRAPNGSEKLV